MRLISGPMLFAALISALVMPVAAAPVSQEGDARAILEASALVMDSAQSMSFSGSIDMTIPTGRSPVAMSLPLSGAYQAPDRMTMSVQMPEMGKSTDMIVVGSQVWTRDGQGPWKVKPAERGRANPLGTTHADWFRGFLDPVVTDLGSAYRIASPIDASAALSLVDTGTLSLDLTAASARATVTVDKATSYLTSVQMDLSLPLADRPASLAMTLTMNFSDFDNLAIEILPPV